MPTNLSELKILFPKIYRCCNIDPYHASSCQIPRQTRTVNQSDRMNWTIFQQQVFPIRHKLYRFALRITGSIPDAEDVVQEVLERVWKTPAEQSSSVQNWEAWCMTLTRNRSLDRNRSRSLRRTTTLDGVVERSSEHPGPARTAELSDLAAQVRRLMDELPEKQRLVMHLRDVEELTYEEIAEALQISLDQVKVNLHRARKAIREQLVRLETLTAI